MASILARPICLYLCLILPPNVLAEPHAAIEIPDVLLIKANTATTSIPTSENASHAETNAAQTSAHVPEGCRPLMLKAMAADVKAFTAQSQNLELAKQAQFFEEALSLWTQAVAQCEGRDKEQAQRNLNDSQKIHATISEQMGAGLQCSAIHKDAGAMQEMAKHALGERRWSDASMLFYKAQHMWTLATELCIGNQRAVANLHHDEAELDGYNAEFCAPLFEKAREQTLKLRALAASLSPEDKQNASMVAETLWRDALSQCKGTKVQDIARNNAQAIARERGTPWVARVVPADKPAESSKTSGTIAASTPILNEAKSTLIGKPAVTPTNPLNLSDQGTSHLPNTPTNANATPSKTDTVLSSKPKQPQALSVEFSAEDAKGLSAYSGIGKIVWASGDVYEGDLVKGQRHGKGLFVWANGQSYNGQWVNDKALGQGSVKFADGNQYEGSVLDGTPHGQGRMLYASGDTYTGNFNAGVPEGSGVYVWKNGQQYDGNWENGYRSGQGRTLFFSGETYVGNYVNDKPDGFGEYNFSNGDKYVGQWKAGKKHGQGIFIWKSGDRWDGIFENDERVEPGKPVLPP